MSGNEYTALAYGFAGVLLLGYAITLWWALRSRSERTAEEES